MAVLITEEIPQQNFETIALKLGSILLEELENQKNIKCLNHDLGVFLERQEPYDKAEGVMINITANDINYTNTNEYTAQGPATFNIDIFTGGVESNCETGNENSRVNLYLYIGLIRFILSSTKYKTLDLPLGTIGMTKVGGVQFDDNYGNQDGSFIRMARVNFEVSIYENQDTFEGVSILGNDTTVKLSETDKGYKFIFNT